MGVVSAVRSEIPDAVRFVRTHRLRIAYIIAFFGCALLLSVPLPDLRPIVAAAALVLPLRVLVGKAAKFDESAYEQFSPFVANVRDLRFAPVAALCLAFPLVGVSLDLGAGWSAFGSLARVVAAAAIGALTWSEALYEKNFYFDRWHPVERLALVGCAALAIAVSPLFVPIFLLVHRCIGNQFRHPGIGEFNWLHSQLPSTLLLVTSSFAIVNLVADVRPHMVLFLLFCGYAAQYVHPGLAKVYYGLDYGPTYYLRHNNPVYLFLNAYKVGWLSDLNESIVLRIGQLSERLKLLLNVLVVFIEVSALFVLFSYPTAFVVLSLSITLHLLVFVNTGDNFWKWVTVDLAFIAGLAVVVDQLPVVFTDLTWFALSIPFVLFAHGWMHLARMGWLDTPYAEYFEFEADIEGGETIQIHPNVFRPYDSITTQGSTGTLLFLGEDPKVTYSYGGINKEDNKDLHRELLGSVNDPPLDPDEAATLVDEKGVEWYDESKRRELERLLRRAVEAERSAGLSRWLRYLTSPREFYSAGISDRESHRKAPAIERIRIHRVDGLWTNEGFQEIRRTEVLSIDI